MWKGLITLIAAFLFLCISGCNEDSPDSTAETLARSVATLRSSDLTYINLDSKFNSWLLSRRSSVVSEVRLQLKTEPPVFTDLGIWALVVRTLPDPSGVMFADEIDVRLFENYTVVCCANTNDPMGTTETADRAFLAVSGYVDFTSERMARFELNFQQEEPLRSAQISGQIVNVVGCWNIAAFEGDVSGCEL